jgi:putative solute:sodium symporter small subunit
MDQEWNAEKAQAYWKENLTLIGTLLAFWAAVSYGCGILLVEPLNNITLPGGLPLGFWFAQQGAIYVFIVLIFIYGRLMDRLDKKYGVGE